MEVFQKLGLEPSPIILAPLAGVSDHPFRRLCAEQGADLTYVEMLSARALMEGSKRTFKMAKRHESEGILGVQITARNPEEMYEGVRILDDMNFETIDLNMGCPVRKVVKTGCGSAALKDPKIVFALTEAARRATRKPLSVKIRIGWDRQHINACEVGQAIEEAGAEWMTVHGRTRSDDYAAAVSLEEIHRVKERVGIPVVGNGNLFSELDRQKFMSSGVDGVMISRGALGNPWLFKHLKTGAKTIGLEEWYEGVCFHLDAQREEYGREGVGAVCMRKHLLWYSRGWPEARKFRECFSHGVDLDKDREALESFVDRLRERSVTEKPIVEGLQDEGRFSWDPKWDMHRKLDRQGTFEASGLV